MDETEYNRKIKICDEKGLKKAINKGMKKEKETGLKTNLDEIYDVFSDKNFIKNQMRDRYSGKFYKVPACYNSWYFCLIDLDGNVKICCQNDKITAGNIYKRSFKEIWMSKEFQKIRELGKFSFKPGTEDWKECNFCYWDKLQKDVHQKLMKYGKGGHNKIRVFQG